MQTNRICLHPMYPDSFHSCLKRLKHERIRCSHLEVTPLEYKVDSNSVRWILSIPGPPESPYAGKIYDLAIYYESSYPFSAPILRFCTPIFHPNITPNGQMSNLMTDAWTPYNTLQTLYDRAIQIMIAPLKEYPYNDEAANLWGTPEFAARVNA
jgi:ubiquitin-conjugating enzyme E2 C